MSHNHNKSPNPAQSAWRAHTGKQWRTTASVAQKRARAGDWSAKKISCTREGQDGARELPAIIQSRTRASKGNPPVRGAGYEPLLLRTGESQETPTRPRGSRQQKTTTEQEQLGAPSAGFTISTSKQSQTRRQIDPRPATPISPPAVNWLTYLPPTYETLGRSVTRRKCGPGHSAIVTAVQSGLVYYIQKNETAEEMSRLEDRGSLKIMLC